jgi:putative ferrous iron transport protein C
MLLQLKNYIQQHKKLSLAELSHFFNISPELARDMLNCYIIKGKVRPQPKTPKCGSACGKCNPVTTEIYEWVF